MSSATNRRGPSAGAVFREQVRFIGIGIRRDAIVGIGLLVLLTIAVLHAVRRDGTTIDFSPENDVAFAALGFLTAFLVWRAGDRARDAYLWTLPVGHRLHAFLRIAAGWVWLIAAVIGVLLWLIALVLYTGGTFEPEPIRLIMLDPAVPGGLYEGRLDPRPWSEPAWGWIVPFTAATVTYLLACAIALATERPWRWIGGVVVSLALVGVIAGEYGYEVLNRSFDGLLAHPWGLDAVFTGGTETLRTEVILPGQERPTKVWYGLPTSGEWLKATLLWLAVALAGLYAATYGRRESRRAASSDPSKASTPEEK